MRYAKWFDNSKIGDRAFVLTTEDKILEVEILQYGFYHFDLQKVVVGEHPNEAINDPKHKSRADAVRVQLVEDRYVISVIPNAIWPTREDWEQFISEQKRKGIEVPRFSKLDLTQLILG